MADAVEPAWAVDFDLDLNPADDPNAGFVYVQRDVVHTEAAVFDVLPRDVKDRAATD